MKHLFIVSVALLLAGVAHAGSVSTTLRVTVRIESIATATTQVPTATRPPVRVHGTPPSAYRVVVENDGPGSGVVTVSY